MSTVLFALLAYAQVKNQVQLHQFRLNLNEPPGDLVGTENAASENANVSVNLWKWIMLLYIASLSFSLIDFVVFWSEEVIKTTRNQID